MSAAQLARQAEETPEFENLVADICGLEPGDYGDDPDADYPPWLDVWEFLRDLLSRSGYYAAVISNQPTEDIQQRIVDRAPVLDREVVYLRWLEGCSFARDRFDVCGYSIVRMSAADAEALGADSWQEKIILKLEGHWALQEVARSRSGCVDIFQTAPTHEEAGRGSKRATKHTGQTGIPLDSYLFPLLAIALYSHEGFDIPYVQLAEPGWPLRTLVSSPVHRQTHKVDEASWTKFEAFVKICEKALQRCECWATKLPGAAARRLGLTWIPLWRPIGIAVRHYLRSTFNSGQVLPGWVPSVPLSVNPHYEMKIALDAKMRETAIEDELLHYVFCLEGLLTGDEKDAISHKIATCAALIVGRDDEERNCIAGFVKKAYGVRSDIVHGKAPAKEIDLLKLRRLCQRLLAVVFSLIADHDKPEDLEQTLRRLPLSEGLRQLVGKSREKVLDLISDSARLV
jgi:hypothetical protein